MYLPVILNWANHLSENSEMPIWRSNLELRVLHTYIRKDQQIPRDDPDDARWFRITFGMIRRMYVTERSLVGPYSSSTTH